MAVFGKWRRNRLPKIMARMCVNFFLCPEAGIVTRTAIRLIIKKNLNIT